MFLFAVLAVSSLVAPAAAAPAVETHAARIDAIFSEWNRVDSPGCAVGIYRDGEIVAARGYGMANLELNSSITPETVFDIGSTAKQFTAMSILLLARDGKLSLDDDVRKLVPEVPDYGRPIRIRNLLHHTSGLRDYLGLFHLAGVRTEDYTNDDDALAMIARQKALNFQPGDRFLYSNSGYFLLSIIVKRASGRSLRDFAAERIFHPLGMRHTQYNDDHTRVIPNRATGYEPREGGGFAIDMSPFEQTGDGGVVTSVEDLLLWDRNFYEPRVGDARLLAAMQTVATLNSGEKLQYANALRIGAFRGLRTVSHGGSWAGYRAELLRFPDQKLSVACLCNLGTADPSRLARRVAEAYLENAMAKAPDAKTSAADAPAASEEELDLLSGVYRDRETGAVWRLQREGKKLVAEGPAFRGSLKPAGPRRFTAEEAGEDVEVDFEEPSAAARLRMRVIDGERRGEAPLFERIETWSPSAQALAALAGEYRSDELDTVYRFVIEGNRLRLRHRTLPRRPWQPSLRDHFTLGSMEIVFERGAAGAPTGFVLNAGRVRGISFRRVKS